MQCDYQARQEVPNSPSKRDLWPRYRLRPYTTYIYSQCLFEATHPLLYSAGVSNQMECVFICKIFSSLETNTVASKGIEVAITPLRIGQTLTFDHALLECAALQERNNEYHMAVSFNTSIWDVSRDLRSGTCVRFGLFYLIWTVEYSMQFFIWISFQLIQFWTWSSLNNCTTQSGLLICHILWAAVRKLDLCMTISLSCSGPFY